MKKDEVAVDPRIMKAVSYFILVAAVVGITLVLVGFAKFIRVI